MMELLWSLRRPTFNLSFFNNSKTHNGNKETVSSSSHGYNKLSTRDDDDPRTAIGLTELGTSANPPISASPNSTGDVTPDEVTPDDVTAETDDFSMTDDEDDRTCIVCDLTFITRRHLRYHQKKKRHFGCSVCEDVFNTRISLEYHKEEVDHWTVSDDEDEYMCQPDEQAMESEDDEQLLF